MRTPPMPMGENWLRLDRALQIGHVRIILVVSFSLQSLGMIMRTERIAVSSAISALILLWGSLCSAQVQGQSAQQVLAGLRKAQTSGAKPAAVSAGSGKPSAAGVQRLKSPHGLTLSLIHI